MSEKRRYRMRKRAQRQDQTRQRIVEAAMHLHEEVGPRATTISAIAERAGVQRLTVYRHFPDDNAVFSACTQHWLELNPPPDPGAWASLQGEARMRAAIAAFYRYYAATRRMWTVSYRDAAAVPALQGPMAAFEGFLDTVVDGIVAPAGKGRPDPVRATLRHALAFPTWAELDARGMGDADKMSLVAMWIDGASK